MYQRPRTRTDLLISADPCTYIYLYACTNVHAYTDPFACTYVHACADTYFYACTNPHNYADPFA